MVVSTPMTAEVFLAHQLEQLAKLYDVTLIANMQGHEDLQSWVPKTISVIDVQIHRTISPWSDVRCFFKLKRLFKKNEYSLVHSVSPKAGLLSMLAARSANVPVRIHTFTGQVWANKRGVSRWFLRRIDKVIAARTTTILVDSHSQRQFLLENKVVTEQNSSVLGNGSISGVDCKRFKDNQSIRQKEREQLHTANDAIVFLFVGRLKKEKGILELVGAFNKVKQEIQNTELWFVGPDEEDILGELEQVGGVKCIQFTTVPEHFMAAADILCLPSYREGFGSVVIEAAACGIPSIASNIYGLRDSIDDGKTGILVQPKSVASFAQAMTKLAEDEILRLKMGKTAQGRSKEKFSQSQITTELLALYECLLEEVIKERCVE
jgi:glycosyltransferase involved in cell wall biosynthesis